MRIAVDCMGGDNAPDAIIEGICLALAQWKSLEMKLYGPQSIVEDTLCGKEYDSARVEIIDAPEVISNHESPAAAVRGKRNSSLVKAMESVRHGETDGFVSAGSTGAVMAAALLRVGRIKGIDRPALSPIMPGRLRPFILVDCGANADCKIENLSQFALMGNIYMKQVMNVASPGVGLVNIGAEAEKGNELYKAAHKRMAEESTQGAYRFLGNIEARDIAEAPMDVLVADGFTGNIILKFMEGMAATLMSMLKEEMTSGIVAKAGAALVLPKLKNFKKRMDYTEYGGAPLLGINGPVVKAHGSSNGYAFFHAIRQMIAMHEHEVVRHIRDGLAQITQ